MAASARLDQTTQATPAAAAGAGPEAGAGTGAAAAAEYPGTRTSHNGPLDPLSSLLDLTEFQRYQLDHDAALQAQLRQQNLAVVVIHDPTAEATQRALRDILFRPQDLQGQVDQALARQSGDGNFQGARPRLDPRAMVFRPAGDLEHSRNVSQGSQHGRQVSQGNPGSLRDRSLSQGSQLSRQVN